MRAIVFVLLMGCNNYYSGKDLVIVQPNDALLNWNYVEGDELVNKGIRLWDEVGAHFRTKEQLTLQEKTIDAQTLPIEGKYGQLNGNPKAVGIYIHYEAKIQIRLDYWDGIKDCFECMECVIAHEVGHAMGLEHVFSDPDAIMYPQTKAACYITQADREEYNKYWGPK